MRPDTLCFYTRTKVCIDIGFMHHLLTPEQFCGWETSYLPASSVLPRACLYHIGEVATSKKGWCGNSTSHTFLGIVKQNEIFGIACAPVPAHALYHPTVPHVRCGRQSNKDTSIRESAGRFSTTHFLSSKHTYLNL